MKVKNLKNTSGKECAKCDSWLEHWETHTGKTISYCLGKGCSGSADLGAHVKKVGAGDDSHYIVPLCYECNKKTDEFELEPNTPLAPAESC
jgi:hypothetical protein